MSPDNKTNTKTFCPDCDSAGHFPSRREFLKSAGTLAAVAAVGTPLWADTVAGFSIGARNDR